MAAWNSVFRDAGRSRRSLSYLRQYGGYGSPANTSASWAEFELLFSDFTASPCLTSDNESCTNMTSLDDGSTYAYSVWQVSVAEAGSRSSV